MKKPIHILTGTITGGCLLTAALLAAGNLRAADSDGTYGTTPGSTTPRTSTSTSTSGKATDFIKEASQGNQAEISEAELAQSKSQSAEIKNLAKMVRDDHQQAQTELQTLAQAHGVTLDQNLTWSEKREQNKLEKLSGMEFDQQYAKNTLEDHANEIKKFEKAAQQIQETDVKQYAENCLPKLRAHLTHAEQAAKAVGVDEKTITSITKKVPGAAVGGAGEREERGTGGTKTAPSEP